MQRKIRIAQWGVGKMGRVLVRLAVEHGGEIVAAFARNPRQIGGDVGTLSEIGAIGIAISDIAEAEAVLRATKPDICLVAAQGTVAANMEPYTVCARAGVNVISIGEDCMWPYTMDAELAARLDAIAKQHGVTFSASGHPEVSWGGMIANAAAAMGRVDRIKGEMMMNSAEYGASVSEAFGLGWTVGEFEAKFGRAADGGQHGCLPGDQNGYLCAALGLTVTGQTFQHVPIVGQKDIHAEVYGRVIEAGRVIGGYMKCVTETAENITVELWAGGKVYDEGEADYNRWVFYGEPDQVTLEFNSPHGGGAAMTCAPPIYRIPDVIDAAPGFITTNMLPAIRYQSKPMHHYVRSID